MWASLQAVLLPVWDAVVAFVSAHNAAAFVDPVVLLRLTIFVVGLVSADASLSFSSAVSVSPEASVAGMRRKREWRLSCNIRATKYYPCAAPEPLPEPGHT